MWGTERKLNFIRRLSATALALMTCFLCACMNQSAELVSVLKPTKGAPVASGDAIIVVLDAPTPEVVAPPTPTPAFPISIPAYTGKAPKSDGNGVPIIDPDLHYSDYYLQFIELRVYEHGNGCFLDGVCINSYGMPLTGQARITFYDKNGTLYGYGNIVTANGGTVFKSGRNVIYAEILTEVDVQLMEWRIEITEFFAPVE